VVELHADETHCVQPENYLPATLLTGGVHPLKLLAPQHRPPLQVLRSYTYPDRVYAILSYTRLLH